jgi:TM2 domain-containing membrane protein YozV
MFCATCGSQVDGAQGFCSKCGNRIGSSQAITTTPGFAPAVAPVQQVVLVKAQKNPGVAAVLSFFWSGLGQIYNGEIGKGVLLLIVYIVSWWMMFIIIGFVTTPILWIYGMIDAYRTAERINAAGGSI